MLLIVPTKRKSKVNIQSLMSFARHLHYSFLSLCAMDHSYIMSILSLLILFCVEDGTYFGVLVSTDPTMKQLIKGLKVASEIAFIASIYETLLIRHVHTAISHRTVKYSNTSCSITKKNVLFSHFHTLTKNCVLNFSIRYRIRERPQIPLRVNISKPCFSSPFLFGLCHHFVELTDGICGKFPKVFYKNNQIQHTKTE